MGRIFDFISKYQPTCRIIWATITPVNEKKAHESHAQWKDFDRYEQSVVDHNLAAKEVCNKKKVEVNDLFAFYMENKIQALQNEDGVHFKEEGSRRLGEKVATVLNSEH